MTGQQTPARATHKAVVGELEMHYETAGQGQPVILIHGSAPGATGTASFGASLDLLAGHARMLAPDMPGWGESSAVEYDARAQLDALVGFMDATGIERAVFVGHSLGGARALDVAAAHPERVSGLVLLAAPAPGADLFASAPSEGGRAVFQAYNEPTLERMTALTTLLFHDQSAATPGLADAMTQSAEAHPEHCANFLAAIANGRFSLFAAENPAVAIAGIAAPTLIVHGRDDRVVGYEAALRLVSSIADSRLLLLNGCGHYPHHERGRGVHAAIGAFLHEISDSNPGDR